MTEFFTIIFGLPTVIFTGLSLFSLGYWMIGALFGLGNGGDGFDIDASGPDVSGPDVSGGDISVDGGDVSVDASDAGVDGGDVADGADGSHGFFVTALQFFDLHLVPLTIAFTLVSVLGWAFSSFGVLLLSSGNTPGVGLAVVIFVAALLLAVIVGGRVSRALAPVFAIAPPTRRHDLIGRLCVVKTGRVDANFGQAEVIDAEHGSHLIQVRCDIANELSNGSRALIVQVDDEGQFLVSPDVDSLL